MLNASRVFVTMLLRPAIHHDLPCARRSRATSLPIAGGDERRPEERVGALVRRTTALKDAEAGLVNRVGSAQVTLEPGLVERVHPVSRGLIFNRPQTHDHG